jgi:hypothetical protein
LNAAPPTMAKMIKSKTRAQSNAMLTSCLVGNACLP